MHHLTQACVTVSYIAYTKYINHDEMPQGGGGGGGSPHAWGIHQRQVIMVHKSKVDLSCCV